MPAVKNYISQVVLATVTLVVGAVVFGISHFVAETEPYLAFIVAITFLLLAAILSFVSVLGFNYLMAPSAMWRRDRQTIAELRERLTPALHLSFQAGECVRYLRDGTVTESTGGNRWFSTKRSRRHYMVKCVNISQMKIDNVEAYATSVKRKDYEEYKFANELFLSRLV